MKQWEFLKQLSNRILQRKASEAPKLDDFFFMPRWLAMGQTWAKHSGKIQLLQLPFACYPSESEARLRLGPHQDGVRRRDQNFRLPKNRIRH